MRQAEFPEPDDPPEWFQEMVLTDPETQPIHWSRRPETAENQALDIKIVQRDRASTASGYPFKTFDEMACEPTAKRWLVKGIFARGESSAWIAPPGGMKSALLAEASISVAGGFDWHGYRNKEAAGVVYFAIERADLVRRRLRAHAERQGLKGLPIAVVGVSIDLTKPDAFKKIITTIRDASETLKAPIGLVIVDTFAKLIAAGGGDENSAKDQGMVFANLQRVKNNTDTHVALIGHTGKDENKGMRGSNAALGDVDMMVTLSGDDVRTATVTKANDAPEGPLFSFASEVHSFGTDEDGDPVSVNIVSSETVETAPKAVGDKPLAKNQRIYFRILHGAGKDGMLLADWNSAAREAGLAKSSCTEARYALEDKKMIRNHGDRWNVCHD
jgi:RecA-family ATPase